MANRATGKAPGRRLGAVAAQGPAGAEAQGQPEARLAKLTELTPDPRNANKGTERGSGMLEQSIRKHGAGRSIFVDRNGVILGGNKTHQAAVDSGLEGAIIVPTDGKRLVVVQRTDLDASDPAALELALADNRIGEVSLAWDAEVLAELQASGVSLEGLWSEQELAILLNGGAKSGLTDPDDVPAERATDIQAGDLFELGAHRLLCGSSTTAADLERVMASSVADILVTSPPYNQRIDKFKPSGMHREGDWVGKVERLAYPDSLPEDEYQRQQVAALLLWDTALRTEASIFYNHKNRYREKAVVSPLEWLVKGPFTLRQEIVWSRPGSVTQNARMFLPSDERIYWLYKGDDFYFDDSIEIKSWSTVWPIGLETNRSHAAAFPVELPSRAIRACSRPDELVLEPYCGSGTTLIAAEQSDRRCAAIEIDPVNCQVIIDRFEAFSGSRAVKVGEAVRA